MLIGAFLLALKIGFSGPTEVYGRGSTTPILDQLTEKRLTMKEVSLRDWHEPFIYSAILKRSVPAQLDEEVRGRPLAEILGVDENLLRGTWSKLP